METSWREGIASLRDGIDRQLNCQTLDLINMMKVWLGVGDSDVLSLITFVMERKDVVPLMESSSLQTKILRVHIYMQLRSEFTDLVSRLKRGYRAGDIDVLNFITGVIEGKDGVAILRDMRYSYYLRTMEFTNTLRSVTKSLLSTRKALAKRKPKQIREGRQPKEQLREVGRRITRSGAVKDADSDPHKPYRVPPPFKSKKTRCNVRSNK